MIHINNLNLRLGQFCLREINLTINEGEYMALLGPTGAGKSVLVECILGIQRPETGRIIIGEQDITPLYPEERNIGYVPQDYMLFPNMTVEQNLVYGLKARRRPVEEIRNKAEEMLALLNIHSLRTRLPLNLSGGERQRVALGRALITNPKILLLDEPLSALEENLRYELSSELRRIHGEIGGTFLHVCHNLEEAASVGDRWAIMRDGRIEQVETPDRIMTYPASEFVAQFTRTRNIFRTRAEQQEDRSVLSLNGKLQLYTAEHLVGDVTVAIRPENIQILKGNENPACNQISGRIVRITPRAVDQELEVDVGVPLTVSVRPDTGQPAFRIDQIIRLHIPESVIHFIPT